MKMLARCLVLISLLCSAHAQTPACDLSPGKKMDKARMLHFTTIRASGADFGAVHFATALEFAKMGNYQDAWFDLQLALESMPWLDPASEPEFKPLRGCPVFRELVEQMEIRYPRTAHAKIAFTVGPKDLIPEGLAGDPADGSLYLSSIYHRKIVKIAPDGSVIDFVTEGQDGLLGVLGIKVDARDRSVWAASERAGEAALFHFDLHGKLLGKYSPQEKGKHLFNDLAITSRGDVYVTDSEDASVYKLRQGSDRLRRLSLGPRFYPNGIVLSPDEKILYVAHAFGIVMMDLKKSTFVPVKAGRDISTAQIDGMYFWRGHFIAVQNGFGPNRIVSLQLSDDQRSIIAGWLLEFRSENLELPTTGAILNGRFYYIVNSQVDHEEDGKLKNEGELRPVKIATIELW
jgi:hypothetical protein